MAEGVLVVAGAQRSVLVYNRSVEEILGLPPGRLHVGAPLADAAPLPALLGVIDRQYEDGSAALHEYLVDAAPRGILRVSLALLRGAPGAPPSVLIILHDPRDTERWQSMRREFVASVSHEVRTPLSAIRGCSATLLGGALGDGAQARRFVEVIEQHAERLGHLVDDLSQLADLEQGLIELAWRPIDVAAAVDRAVVACRDLALRGGVALEVAVAADTPAIAGDRELLEQALVRLIDNAVRHTPPAGSVSVRVAPAASRQPPAVCFAVVDTGVGVPPQHLPRLAERFFRVDKGRSRGQGGSGLGLAIVKHIVQAHGGTMRIESELQQGTAVTLFWPVDAASPHLAAQNAVARGS